MPGFSSFCVATLFNIVADARIQMITARTTNIIRNCPFFSIISPPIININFFSD